MMLLDTHTYYWFICEDDKLPAFVKEQIENEERVFVSIVTFWELAIKFSLGKLKLPAPVSTLMEECNVLDFAILPISADHLDKVAELPWIHRDPFDRLLISQAQAEGLTLITKDDNIRKYHGIETMWIE